MMDTGVVKKKSDRTEISLEIRKVDSFYEAKARILVVPTGAEFSSTFYSMRRHVAVRESLRLLRDAIRQELRSVDEVVSSMKEGISCCVPSFMDTPAE